ncbi:hypothetical protein [Ralstonia sp. ASV6]|uniref:hypothetical protein n=1 Tax=Ralstonia sp. ASV6 TaxID=2795124 RepID=UPI0018EB0E03|nr:hypothetical protein [Ralstonia sp. ASV6]
MSENNKSLSRRQLQNIQIARGLSASDVKDRTAIPAASYDTLFTGDTEDGKEHNKMISQRTFKNLIDLLAINRSFSTLRSEGVIEWCARGDSKAAVTRWQEAVLSLLSELCSDNLLVVEITTPAAKSGWFRRAAPVQRMVLLHDRTNNFRIALPEAPADMLATLQHSIGVPCETRFTITPAEFKEAREMIRHKVFHAVQFDALSGERRAKYAWRDVQAAAREFGFLPDDLVELMYAKAQERANEAAAAEAAERQEGFGVHQLRLVAN